MTQSAEQKGWALIRAIEEFRTDDALALVTAGADLYVQNGFIIMHPFHHAAMTNNLKVAQEILNAGYDVNGIAKHVQGDGSTALIIAVERNLRDMTEFLLQNKADPNIATGRGVHNGDAVNRWARTPKPDPEIFDLLVAHGARIDRLAGDDRTAFEFIQSVYTTRWLESSRADIEPGYKAILAEVVKVVSVAGAVVQAPVALMPKIKLRRRA